MEWLTELFNRELLRVSDTPVTAVTPVGVVTLVMVVSAEIAGQLRDRRYSLLDARGDAVRD